MAGYLRVQGAAEPDDLTGEVFLGVVASIERFQGDEAGFRSWVFTIAHHRLLDERRTRSRRPPGQPLDEMRDRPNGGDAENEALARLGDDRVRALLEALSPDQRDVVFLRVVADLSVDQVAAAVGKRPGAVKALQRRGLEALRRKLAREGVTL